MSESVQNNYQDGWGVEDHGPRRPINHTTIVESIDPVRAYLSQIGRTPLLTAAEEVDLSKRIEAGVYAGKLLLAVDGSEEVPYIDKETVSDWGQKIDADTQHRRDLAAIARDGQNAKDHMLEANLRLVVSLAKRYTGKGLPFLDVIQEGNTGLVRAVEKFDYTKGFKFSTYATWWIRQSITRALADTGRTIRIPVHMAEQVNRVLRARRRMYQDLEREPTAEELGLELEMPEARVSELLEYSIDTTSLDRYVSDTEESRLGEFIEDADAGEIGDAYEVEERAAALDTVLDTLKEREREVIKMRFGLDGSLPATLDAIGKHFGLSRERVRQIERETMQKLRDPDRMQHLQAFKEV